MLTITWLYERTNDDHPFYHESSDEARNDHVQFEELRDSSGLVHSYEKFTAEDGLSYTSIWTYENVGKYIEFMDLISTVCPAHPIKRNIYVEECGHKITAIANEPIFQALGTGFTSATIRIIGGHNV